jgi:hypothetical protein
MIGYFIGDNEAAIGTYLKKMQWIILGGIGLVITLYTLWKHR